MDEEIPIIKDGDKKTNAASVGLCAILAILILIPVTVIAIPVVAALYRWGFGS